MGGTMNYNFGGGVTPIKSATNMQSHFIQHLSSFAPMEEKHITLRGLPSERFSKNGGYPVKKKICLDAVCFGGARDAHTLGGAGGLEKFRVKSAANGVPGSQANALRDSPQNEQFSSIGTAFPPPNDAVSKLSKLSVTEQQLFLLAFFACSMTGAVSCLLFVAIPTLRSWRRAAIAVGKLADAAREELPGTMAAIRLSGMEISDLTMELSDLGQEISAGVRSSSRAVRIAEAGLRRLGSVTTSVAVQGNAEEREKLEAAKPSVARAAKGTRDALVQSRSLVRSLVTLTRLSTWFGRWWTFVRPFQRKSVPSRPQ